MALAGVQQKGGSSEMSVWYHSSKYCSLLFFNTLACLPKIANEFASVDMEVLFFSALFGFI